MKYLKTFLEKVTDNDYRNDDPISKLKMMELVYNTLVDNEGDLINSYEMSDPELDMEDGEITFKYKGVPFRLIIEREEEEVVGENAEASSIPGSPDSPVLPRKSTVNRIKKLGRKSGLNKSVNSSGGRNTLSGKISTHESVKTENDFIEITTLIPSKDYKLFKDVINRGIDSHLEGFVKSKFEKKGNRCHFNFHKSELPILLRRLQESADAIEDEGYIESWINDIKEYKD